MTEPTITSIIPGLLGSVAWFLSLFSGVYCKFASTTFTSTNLGNEIKLNFGIWTYQGYTLVSSQDGTVVYESCIGYPDTMNVDPTWKTARAFATLTILIGGMVTLWALLACCLPGTSKSAYRLGGMIFMLCCLFQGLSLLFLRSSACSDDEELANRMPLYDLGDACTMSVGAKCTIAATVLWFLAAIPAFKVELPQRGAVGTETHAEKQEKQDEADEHTLDPDAHDFVNDEPEQTTDAAGAVVDQEAA